MGAVGDGRVVRLLGDEHRGARVSFPELDETGQGVRSHGAAIFGEAVDQPDPPVLDVPIYAVR